jgi:hypothetical protein
MAKIGEVEAANRYNGIPAGPRLDYTYEIQAGIPVDGTNALLRLLSPFTLRLLVPDALITMAAEAAKIEPIGLITAAAQGASQNKEAAQLAKYLGGVTAVESSTLSLESFVSSGQFLADVGASTYPTIADAVTAADIALQVRRILAAPPLTLLVNPRDMTITYNNIQNHSIKTRYGLLFERWGEEQPTISFSGSTSAFIAGVAEAPGTDPLVDLAQRQTSSPSGVQFASRRNSASWQNFTSLFQFYKNNGYIYDTARGSEAHLFAGVIAIDFDQWTYVGNIESFEYSFDDGKPHNVDWSMEFKVSRMYDNAVPSYAVQPISSPTVSPNSPAIPTLGRRGGSIQRAADILTGANESDEAVQRHRYGEIPFELLR